MNKKLTIGLIGFGYVGKSINHVFKDIADIRIYDTNPELCRNSFKDTILESESIFICVPTPTRYSGEQDLDNIRDVSLKIGRILLKKNRYTLIVVKSTVLPRTTRDIIIPLIEKYSKKECGNDFGVCMNPEFLTESSRTWTNEKEFEIDFNSEDKIVIGEFDKKSGDLLEKLYRPLQKKIYRVNLETAELIKYAANCCLASRISFWNEIFLLCQKIYGIDSKEVADIVCTDKRIGKYGSVHGLAFSGKCLPKDSKAFANWASRFIIPNILLGTVWNNETMKRKYGERK